MAPPSAYEISVAEVVELLDGQFAAVAAAVERRGFALWVGSGMSFGRAPNIGEMLERALEHLRQRANRHDPNCRFRPVLMEALARAGLAQARRDAVNLDVPVAVWPERDEIIEELWDRYADVLDLRVPGEADDYMLWNAVDVRATYGAITAEYSRRGRLACGLPALAGWLPARRGKHAEREPRRERLHLATRPIETKATILHRLLEGNVAKPNLREHT